MGAAFIVAAVPIAAFVVFQLTVRVDMDDHSVTRSWLLGCTVVPVEEITRLSWGGARGVLMLTIRYGKKTFIQLSTYAFTESELREIQKEVIAAHGLEGEPLLPVFAEQVGYVDIAEMSDKKNEMHRSAFDPKRTP